jgi:alkylated DNA repair dioxygenase AlkB
MNQLPLLTLEPRSPKILPQGFLYEPNFLTEAEETGLLTEVEALDWRNFEMHGVIAKRRVYSYGYNYGPSRRNIEPGLPIPKWLQPIIEKAATRFSLPRDAIAAVLINEYRPGAAIGWHRDAPAYETIIGISLGSPARFRLRPYPDAAARERQQPVELQVEPRSVYLISGAARWQWQHHIPAARGLRYSITLRTLRDRPSSVSA